MYSLRDLRPINSDDLIRLGRNEDGGYVLNERLVSATDLLLSFGISSDWSFEEAFYRYLKHKETRIWAYDFSVDFRYFIKMSFQQLKEGVRSGKMINVLHAGYFLKTAIKFLSFFDNEKVKFFKKGIDSTHSGLFVTFNDIFGSIPQEDVKVFVKMDIEGYEYKVLKQMAQYSDRIIGFIVEFHELENKSEEFVGLLNLFREKDFVIIHVHPNNAGGVIEGTNLPKMLEVTFAKQSFFSADELKQPNTRRYPIQGLDCSCIRDIPELEVDFNTAISLE